MAALIALVLPGACVSSKPYALPAAFAPPSGISWARPAAAKPPACLLALGEVRDVRVDSSTMGEMGGRFIHPESPERWVRGALETLSQDGRLRFGRASSGDVSALILNVDMVQGYMSSWSTTKHAVVVLRVRYMADGATVQDQAFRGEINEMNWADMESEIRGGLNDALKRAVAALDDDLVARCSAGPGKQR